MATAEMKLSVEVVQFRVIFWPIATWSKVGDVERLTVFRLSVYERAGDAKKFLWKCWRERT